METPDIKATLDVLFQKAEEQRRKVINIEERTRALDARFTKRLLDALPFNVSRKVGIYYANKTLDAKGQPQITLICYSVIITLDIEEAAKFVAKSW